MNVVVQVAIFKCAAFVGWRIVVPVILNQVVSVKPFVLRESVDESTCDRDKIKFPVGDFRTFLSPNMNDPKSEMMTKLRINLRLIVWYFQVAIGLSLRSIIIQLTSWKQLVRCDVSRPVNREDNNADKRPNCFIQFRFQHATKVRAGLSYFPFLLHPQSLVNVWRNHKGIETFQPILSFSGRKRDIN